MAKSPNSIPKAKAREAVASLPEHLRAETLRELTTTGPRRVVTDARGYGDTAEQAAAKGIAADVLYVRDDGWTLGAPARFAEVARAMWADLWVCEVELAKAVRS